MPKAFLAAALAAVAGGCVHPQPTQAVVAQLTATPDGPRFRGCTINLAWTEQDLIENCGAPDLGFVAWANRPGSNCAMYRTSARSFAAGLGADLVAVCLTRAPAATESGKAMAQVRVWEVFGLSASDISKIPQPGPVLGPPGMGAKNCCKVCTIGKACGDTCISREYTCHVGPGCACDANP